MIRDQGRDLHAEFVDLLPTRPRPITIQRWSVRRVCLLLLMVPAAILVAIGFRLLLVNNDAATTPLSIDQLDCREPAPLWLEAQSVPTASLVPCVETLPEGWSFGVANVRNGRSRFTLDHDRVGVPALVVRLTATCDTSGAAAARSGQPGTRRFERVVSDGSTTAATWYTLFPGGCVTVELHPVSGASREVLGEALSTIGFTTREELRQTLERRSDGRLELDPANAG